MANTIPAGLKAVDIGRFAVRAAQVEKAKPVVAYWCNFWIVNQIIERGLHTSDDEVKLYTTDLVDKLEQFKKENPDNDAVTDGMAASAYVEQFGMEVFNRAEATMMANKVTKQTADTFQAAATFLELCQIWNPPDAEVAAKIKFSKYHALRIVKAIKAGENPNDSNPVIDKPEEIQPDAQGLDPDAQLLDDSAVQRATQSNQPSVEDIPDESDNAQRQMARQSSLDESLHPSRAPSIPQSRAPPPNVVPSPAQNMDIDESAALNLPSAPQTFAHSSTDLPNLPDTPSNLGASRPPGPHDAFQSFPPQSTIPPQSPALSSHDASSFYARPNPGMRPSFPPQPPAPAPAPYTAPQPVVPTPVPAAPGGPPNPHSVDDNSIGLAQKHARWAVSALTFDDVNTAIKELKNSLRYLGAE